jgi:hypothetical protein
MDDGMGDGSDAVDFEVPEGKVALRSQEVVDRAYEILNSLLRVQNNFLGTTDSSNRGRMVNACAMSVVGAVYYQWATEGIYPMVEDNPDILTWLADMVPQFVIQRKDRDEAYVGATQAKASA